MSLLRVQGLNVTFGGSVRVVRDVDFALGAGEVLVILGESGSGKSVTLKALMRLLPPRKTAMSGTVEFDGQDLLAMSEGDLAAKRGRDIAMIFQEPALAFDPVFTIGRQIAETVQRHEGVSAQAAMARARELLDLVQIPSAERRLKAYPHELSGGMRQRAMIALALSCRPKLLLADEPTTALDATVQIQILLLLRRLQRELGMAVILVTHDVGVAVEIADRIAVMYGGRFLETGSVRDIIRAPMHPYTKGLFASTVHGAVRGQRLEAIPGNPPNPAELGAGCGFADRCRLVEPECRGTDIAAYRPADGRMVRCRLVGMA
jgi:peptide/nickel transport system ATP-binding protein